MNRNEEELVEKECENFSATINNTLLKFTDISSRINNDTECKLLKTYYYDTLDDTTGKISALNKLSELLKNYTETSELAALVGLRIKPSEEFSYANLHSDSDDTGSINAIDQILNETSLYSLENGLLVKNNDIYSVFTDSEYEKLKIVVKLNKYSFSNVLNSLGNEKVDNSIFEINEDGYAVYVASNFELNETHTNSLETLTDGELLRNGDTIKYTIKVKDGLYYVKYADAKPLNANALIPLNLIILSCILIVLFLVGFTFFVTVL